MKCECKNQMQKLIDTTDFINNNTASMEANAITFKAYHCLYCGKAYTLANSIGHWSRPNFDVDVKTTYKINMNKSVTELDK